jgi:hypothetical protein
MPEASGCVDQAMPTFERYNGRQGRMPGTHSALDNAKLGARHRVWYLWQLPWWIGDGWSGFVSTFVRRRYNDNCKTSYIRPLSMIWVLFGGPEGHFKITCQGSQEAAATQAIISLQCGQGPTYLPSLLQFVGDQVAATH